MSSLGRDRRRRAIVALAAATTILAISFADYLIADGRIPDVPVSDCDRTLPTCNDAVNGELEDRITRAVELEAGLDDRSYVYMAALSLVALLFSVAAARAPTAAERFEAFRDLGTGTVGLLILGAVVLAVMSGGLIQFPARIVFVPALVGVLLAAIGSLANMSGREAPVAPAAGAAPGDTNAEASGIGALLRGRAAVGAGFAALALTVILAAAGASGAATCESAADPSSDTLLAFAAVAGVVTIAIGIGLLAVRRWLSALALVALPPVIGIYALLVSFCWN